MNIIWLFVVKTPLFLCFTNLLNCLNTTKSLKKDFRFTDMLTANPTKWSNALKQATIADKLFERLWPFCGVGA